MPFDRQCTIARAYGERHRWSPEDAAEIAGCEGSCVWVYSVGLMCARHFVGAKQDGAQVLARRYGLGRAA